MYSPRLAAIVTLSFALAMIACSPATEAPNTLDLAAKATSTTTTTAPIDLGPSDSSTTAAMPEVASAELVDIDHDADATEALHPVHYEAFTLRHGERLDHFARWAALPVEVIAEASGLDLGRPYMAGIEVRIPVEGQALAALEQARDAHHTKRAEGYLASRGGAIGAEFITVRTGDNATTIARDQQGLPLWLVETYNPSVDLDRLRPGQQLMIPVLADIVVDAEDLDEQACHEAGACPDSLLAE